VKRWQTRRLGDLVEILSGFAFDSAHFSDAGDLPIVRIRDVVPGYSSTFYLGEYEEKFVIQDGDLLIGMDGEFNRAKWQGGRALLNQRVCHIEPSNRELDSQYLFHFLPAALKAIEDVTPFVTVKHLSVKTIRDIEIPLPPVAEQKRIAGILDQADALRALRRAALAKLDTLPQAIFADMFGDPVTNPKGWPRVRCADLCDRLTVGIVVKPASYYAEHGVPILRSLNVGPGFIRLDELVYADPEDNSPALLKAQLKTCDIVLVRSGQPGTAAIIPQSLSGAFAVDILIATPRLNLVQPAFLCQFFNSAGGRRLVLSEQRGQVQKHLNVGSLNEAQIPLPPLALQEEFARRVAAVEQLRSAHRDALTKLDELFAALQHRAFRGEL